jgi:hypothetical protein
MNLAGEDIINSTVKLAFVALVAHQVGVHRPELWTAAQLLPWPTIAFICVSASALFGAFHKVFAGMASGVLWLLLVLCSLALVLASAVIASVIHFGSAERSERVINALVATLNAISSCIV